MAAMIVSTKNKPDTEINIPSFVFLHHFCEIEVKVMQEYDSYRRLMYG